MRRRVVGLVAHRGATPETAEDVAQEVAVRACDATPSFSSAEDLFWWCSTVARRIVIDDHRKHDRVTPMAEPLETVDDGGDPQGGYERRQLVRAVLEEFALLPEAQQAAIVRAKTANEYVRRHRARRRLLAVVDAFGAAVAALWRRARVGRHAVAVLAVTTIAAVLLDTTTIAPVTRPMDEGSGRTTARQVAPRPARARTVAIPSAVTAPPVAPRRRTTIDPPLQAGVSAPTPAGELRTGVRQGPADAPLDCLHLGSIGRSVCVDYPRLP